MTRRAMVQQFHGPRATNHRKAPEWDTGKGQTHFSWFVPLNSISVSDMEHGRKRNWDQ